LRQAVALPNFTAGIDTSTVGAYSATHTFTTGDDQSITGHGALSANLAVNISGNVLDHASGSASVTAGNNFQAIAGTSGLNATVQIANASGSRADLQVGLPEPSIGSGLLSGGPAAPYLVAPGGHQDYTATFDAVGAPGPYTNPVSFTAGDDQTLAGHNSLDSIAGNYFGHLARTRHRLFRKQRQQHIRNRLWHGSAVQRCRPARLQHPTTWPISRALRPR